MAEFDVRISDLPGANTLNGTELVPMVQGGVTGTRSIQNIVSEGGLGQHVAAADPHVQYEIRVTNNLTAVTDPTVNDDSTQGYEVLSRWVNTVTAEFWICVVATVGAANWQQQTLSITELGSAALADVGAGNGLDADLLDAQQGVYYLDWVNTTNKPDPVITLAGDATGSVTLTDLGNGTITVTVNNSADSELLDGLDSLQFLRSDVSADGSLLTNLVSATTTIGGVVEKATTQESLDATANKFPDAADVHAAFNQYGLGASQVFRPANADDIRETGFFRADSTTAPAIPVAFNSGSLLHQEFLGNSSVVRGNQVVITNFGDVVTRYRNGSDVWSSWQEIFHTGNFTPADKLDVTAKAADSELLDGNDSTYYAVAADIEGIAIDNAITFAIALG
jgi:hypothetical protein